MFFINFVVGGAALEKLPRNDLPVFNNDPATAKVLDNLVSILKDTHSFELIQFNKEVMKQLVADNLNESRQRTSLHTGKSAMLYHYCISYTC